MRKSRFTEVQIIGMIKEQEAGSPTARLARDGNQHRVPRLKMSMPTRTRASAVCSTTTRAGFLCGLVRKTTLET